nr:hypothetical protein [Tanacetum cinerariifolium]
MTLFNGICDNCIYGAGMPIICTECGGIVRGGLCLPCDLREKNLYNYDPNAYSFNNSNYFPQPHDENYLCNLCGNNSHDGYDCQQQFPFGYEQEPSYNQNYDDNYFSHDLLSYPCCDYCGGSHETFQCQLDNQNVDFSGSDQIQIPQYPDVNPPSPEINLKELAKYDQSTSTDRPLFLNGDEGHSVQDKESLENPFNEIAHLEPEVTTDTGLPSAEDIHPLAVQEPPRESDICQLIEECSVEVSEEQKQKMEDTMFDLVKIFAQILSTKEPEHLLSMGYEHLSLTPEAESDEVKESNAENLLPIPSKCEVTLEDEIECDMPAKDVCSLVFTTFSNPLFKDNDDLDSSDDESLPDEDDGNSQQEEIDIVTKTDDVFEDNPSILRPPPEPPDDELDLEPDSGKDISAVVNKDASDDENDDYFPFMFVIRFFLPYSIFPEISPLLLSAESEDTIFGP